MGQKQKPSERERGPSPTEMHSKRQRAMLDVAAHLLYDDDDQSAADNVIVLDDAEPPLAQRRASRRGPGALAPGSSTDASVVVGVDPALLADTNAVMDHLFCREKLWMVPPTFLDGQPAVTEASRAMLVDVIVDISMAYKMHDETVHLATTYLDMHLACAPVRRDDLHLLGVGCLLVASKFEEVHPPEIDDLVDRFSSDTNFWDRDDLLAMEQRVLHALGFTLSFATPAAFLRRFVGAPKLGGADPLPHLAAYLCELSLLDASFVAFAPSLRAAAATCLARAAAGARPAWPRALAERTRCTAAQLAPCVGPMLALAKKAATAHAGDLPYASVRAKYSACSALNVAATPMPRHLPPL